MAEQLLKEYASTDAIMRAKKVSDEHDKMKINATLFI